jgi:predicted ATPase
LRTLPVEAVAARLGDRFRLLTGGSASPCRHPGRGLGPWQSVS